MTLPNDDLSNIADPGSLGPDAMTDANAGNAGDLDLDHEHLAASEADRSASDDDEASQPMTAGGTGAPLGPPD